MEDKQKETDCEMVVVKKDKAVDVEDIVRKAVKLPIVHVNRESFLRRELGTYCSKEEVEVAIKHNPAYAGINRELIDGISKHVINYETNKVSAVSFVAGIPGGLAMLATVPADLIQYSAFMIRTMQKLAYLYGFDDFNLSDEEINDETMNQIMVFMGVMFGVQAANGLVKRIAETAANKVARSLAQKALTKGVVYPIVKKIAQSVGIRMTKQIFAGGVAKVVPIVGGVITGGLSYVTFKPCAKRLKNSFRRLSLSDPSFYEDKKDSEGLGVEKNDVKLADK